MTPPDFEALLDKWLRTHNSPLGEEPAPGVIPRLFQIVDNLDARLRAIEEPPSEPETEPDPDDLKGIKGTVAFPRQRRPLYGIEFESKPSKPEPGDDAIIEEMAHAITDLAALKAKAERERDEAREKLAAAEARIAELKARRYCPRCSEDLHAVDALLDKDDQ